MYVSICVSIMSLLLSWWLDWTGLDSDYRRPRSMALSGLGTGLLMIGFERFMNSPHTGYLGSRDEAEAKRAAMF